tara:strand:- start:18 stop:263 length:246 start_codon:yes stop_codon:yes gene_type:complete
MTGEKLLLLLVGTEGGRFSLRIMHEGTKRKDDNGCRFNSFKIIMKNNADLLFQENIGSSPFDRKKNQGNSGIFWKIRVVIS